MPTNTTNYQLKKPLYSDSADINVLNGNFDIIDDALTPAVSQTTAPTSSSTKGKIAAVVGWLANRIRAITGKTNWYDAPAVTLEQCNTHINNDVHTLATASKNGILSAADKQKLDNAASANTASRLMIRDASGRAQVSNPSAANDIANKSYVDSHTHPAATQSAVGFMSAADKTKLDGVTAGAQVNSAITKAEIEAKLTGTISSHTHAAASNSSYGLAILADNTATTDQSSVIPYHYVNSPVSVDLNEYRTIGNWTFYSISSTAANFPTGTWTGSANTPYLEVRRWYTDAAVRQILHKRGTNEIWVRYSTSATTWGAWEKIMTDTHTHSAATTSANGFMSAADKQKLDYATASYTANYLMMRDSYGRAQVQNPSGSYDIVNKTYADSYYVRLATASAMSAILTAYSNASYTTKQVRNIVFWTSGTTPPTTNNGDVVIKTF